MLCVRVLPAKLVPSLHRTIVVNFNVVVITVGVVFQVERVKRQSNQVSHWNINVPGTVSPMGIAAWVAWAGNGAWRGRQGRPTAWHKKYIRSKIFKTFKEYDTK